MKKNAGQMRSMDTKQRLESCAPRLGGAQWKRCFLKILLLQERTSGFRTHADNIFCIHAPVFRAEQLEAGGTIVAYGFDCFRNLLDRDNAQTGHQAVAVVEDAERQVFTVVDMEHKQLRMGPQ